MGKRLSQDFFARYTEIVSKELIGKVLYHKYNEEILSGRIVETEAYLHQNDFACHGSARMTERNAPMHGEPGNIYVYLIYGMYFCINFSTLAKNLGCAVLVRAVEPLNGLQRMAKNRKIEFDSRNFKKKLCSGPGKLCQAFSFNKNDNNKDIQNSNIWLQDDGYKSNVKATKRIGISKSVDLPLRYIDTNSEYLSR